MWAAPVADHRHPDEEETTMSAGATTESAATTGSPGSRVTMVAPMPAEVAFGHFQARLACETDRALPDGLLVTYCWGPSCNAATKGAMLLATHGRQVKELIGGIEYWIREGHPTEGRRPVVRGQEKPTDWGLTA